MAETATIPSMKRIAVVTGANKGIGLEICRQLASNGVMVILTARNEKRGVEAVENLKAAGYTDVVFHQLDLMDPFSIASLAEFIKIRFEKLDILVNNAAVAGATVDPEDFSSLNLKPGEVVGAKAHLVNKILKQTYEMGEECMQTNYYGPKQLTRALIPLLQLSNAARIVNVSSALGQLKNVTNERAKEALSGVDGLTEERVDEVVKDLLQDFKEDLLGTKGWQMNYAAYIVSKAALNAYTRILAHEFPDFCINSVAPGFVKTDMSHNSGLYTVEEGAQGPVMLALMPHGGPSGRFYDRMELSTF